MSAAMLVFLGTVYCLSIGISLLVGLTGGYQSAFMGLGWSTMFFPAVAGSMAWWLRKEGFRVDWSRFPIRFIPIALFFMPVIMHAVMLPLAAGFNEGLPWADWFTRRPDGLYYAPPSRGWGAVTVYGLAARIVVNAGVGLLVVSGLAFFEEVGWRGWLQPRLAERIGARRAIAAVAAVTSVWHVPYALSGIHHLDRVSIPSTAFVMLIGNAGASLVIGWMWARTESIGIVSLAHGSLNNWGQYAFKYMREDAGFGGRESFLLCAGGLALLGAGILLLAPQPPKHLRE